MLQKLHILNYAIIDEIMVEFSENLNVITGETGAGKSILMGALSLILGERAESNTLMNKEKKCTVEGLFKAENNKKVRAFLVSNDLDCDHELLLRREIAVNGKSRAFINDTPVNLGQLKELSSLLVDLHQQFDTLELGDINFQREVIDALAGNSQLMQDYSKCYSQYQNLKRELDALQKKQQDSNAALDYNQFLFDELAEAGFKENELEQLDTELKLLSNAEDVKQQLNAINFELKESDQPLVQQVKILTVKVQALRQFHRAVDELGTRLQSIQLELMDIADTLEDVNESIQYSPERLQLVNDKISLGYRLLKKHNVATTNELLDIQKSLQEKLNDILNLGEAIAAKELQVDSIFKEVVELAEKLSLNRRKAIPGFTEKVNQLLKQVGMPNARIKIEITSTDINEFGTNAIIFMFDANNNDRFESLGKVASGGELSRLMLCIKSLVAQKLHLPTLIFDEIDTGISGEAAKQVGSIMKELSQAHQVLAITHQPQIAAKATAHYFVYKAEQKGKINTSIRLLKEEERVAAIAQMLGGEHPTPAALQNAKEMVAG